MTYVLDACALIAWLRDEAGADQVEALLLDNGATVMIHAVNLCEVYYDCLRSVGERRAEETVATLLAGGVVLRDDMDVDFWKAVGHLKAAGRIALADTFAVTLALREEATLVTSDRHEFEPLIAQGVCPVEVRFIR